MSLEIVRSHLPSEWSRVNLSGSKDYELVELPVGSSKYTQLKSAVSGSFNLGVSKTVRVQNPYLYGQYLLKKEEYENHLYHDTAASKIISIVSGNLDWRLANRVKFGKGVSFSPSPEYANKESSRSNGSYRAMILADVLVQNSYPVGGSQTLPKTGYDTTIGNRGQVYVKYYDNEFYPKYVVYYTNKSTSHGGYRKSFSYSDDVYFDGFAFNW